MSTSTTEWPWIARIARELELHSEETIVTALKAQEEEPLKPLNAFLPFGQAARDSVADFLEQDRVTFVGAVEDQAFAMWGLAEGQFDRKTLEQAQAIQREKPAGTRLWSVFETEDSLKLESAPETNGTESFTCHLCKVSFDVQEILLPFVRHCPGCGAARSEQALLSPLEAQLWLSDEAFGRWAVAKAAVAAGKVAEARKRTGAMALFEVLVQDGLLSLNTSMQALRSEVALSCDRCTTGYQLGVSLLPFLEDLPCPLCGGKVQTLSEVDIEAGEGMAPTQAFRRVGPYRLIRPLGEGGMSSVFLAEDPQGNRVAVKTLAATLTEDSHRKRFEREGVLLSRLKHPNIVSTVGSGLDMESERPYMALELIEGRDLAAILDDRPASRMTLEETIFVLEHVNRALIYSHSKGIVHRDVKPENVLVTVDGQIKLTDFGIALSDEEGAGRITAKDEVLGTPVYVCPEVLGGDAWSSAADMYSLGAFAFRVLTGKPPFEGDTPIAILEAKNKEKAPELIDVVPELPKPFSDLVARLLETTPAERPTAEEFGALLADCAQNTTRPSALKRLFNDAASGTPTVSVTGEISRATRLEPDQTFSHYRIQEEVGRGGMGVVYKAHHLGLDRTVALKVLLAGALAGDEERRRFLREAQAAGGLQHPFIVPILDAGEHDGTYYLTMEHVRGEPLGLFAARIEERDQLLRLFCDICEGVAHAHSRGVIHRDLKPENVLVETDGSPRILDFGIAKRLDDQDEESKKQDLTAEGDILGTLRYMPPEQAAGQLRDVDVRSDVYALGSMLYELVSGATPFGGSIREILHQIHFIEPQPPSVNDLEIPWELDAICLKALEKERDERYQSALELKQDVERFLSGLPIRARRATPWYRLKKWALRNKRMAATIAGTSGLILFLITFIIGAAIKAESDRRQGVIDNAAAAWEHYAEYDFERSKEAFDAALRAADPDEVLRLPVGTTEHLPPELVDALPLDEQVQPRITPQQLRGWADLARRRQNEDTVNAVVVDARQQFRAGRVQKAAEQILLGVAIDPDHPGLKILAAEVAQDLVRMGRTWLEASRGAKSTAERRQDVQRALEAIEQAQRLDKTSRDAHDARLDVAQEMGKLNEVDQATALAQRAKAQAAQLTEQGAVDLMSGDLETARRAFEQALAFDGTSVEAKEGLIDVERKLAERQRQEERVQLSAKVEQLVSEGREAFERDELDAARTKFIQALAFDGGSESARDGLVDVDRIEQSRERVKLERERLAQAEALLKEAQAHYEQGQERFRAGALPEQVRESYFNAIESLKRAMFIVDGYPPAQAMVEQVGREFSGVLVEQGHPELSRFILRIAGADPTEHVQVELPHDPHLRIVEENRVNIRRAFGGGLMRFDRPKSLKPLRDWIKSQGNRYRIVLGVRSEVKRRATHHPQVFLRGFTIRVEDRKSKTISPKLRVDLDDGASHERAVVVDGQGRRVMRAFDTATGFNPQPYVRRLTGIVKAELKKRQ